MKIKIASSILAANPNNLEEEVLLAEKAGADYIHVDVMDGLFVPNKTDFTPELLKGLRNFCSTPFDVHLMVQNPIDYAKIYAGIADIMTVHAERISHEELSILKRKLKNKIGIALNPATSIEKTADFLDHSDMVLIMTVNPGFGGQKFLPETLEKIKALRKFYSGPIEVDGGINDATAKLAAAAGADILVAGTYVFKSMNYREAIEKLRRSV